MAQYEEDRIRDYLVVGDRCALEARLSGDQDDLPRALRFVARALGGSSLGELQLIAHGSAVVVERVAGVVPHSELEVELYRLAARVALREFPDVSRIELGFAELPSGDALSMLTDEGFHVASVEPATLVRNTSPFLRAASRKAETMQSVYDDPFTIPWNFVPRERDVIDHILSNHETHARKSLRLLDLGCGYGKNALIFEQEGFVLHGCDIASEAVNRCRRVVANPANIKVADATCLPWADGFFDLIVDVGCLHCIADVDRPKAVAEIARVCAPDGWLYSRSFKPRPTDWLDAQPFITGRFGLTSTEALSMLRERFVVRIWRENENLNYIEARKR